LGHLWSCLIQQSMLTLGYSEDGDQPLTETVKNEIDTLLPKTAWLKFGAFCKTLKVNWWMNRSSAVLHSILLHFASALKWSRKMRLLSVFYFSFEISIACWFLSRPNWRIVSKLTTDVVTYCTEASNQKSKYVYRKIFFYKKSTAHTHPIPILMAIPIPTAESRAAVGTEFLSPYPWGSPYPWQTCYFHSLGNSVAQSNYQINKLFWLVHPHSLRQPGR